MNDYITDILSRIKHCKLCGNKFLDITYNHNAKYCGKKCRDHSDDEHQRQYMRKRRLVQYRLGKPRSYTLGTFSENWLNQRIASLKRQAHAKTNNQFSTSFHKRSSKKTNTHHTIGGKNYQQATEKPYRFLTWLEQDGRATTNKGKTITKFSSLRKKKQNKRSKIKTTFRHHKTPHNITNKVKNQMDKTRPKNLTMMKAQLYYLWATSIRIQHEEKGIPLKDLIK